MEFSKKCDLTSINKNFHFFDILTTLNFNQNKTKKYIFYEILKINEYRCTQRNSANYRVINAKT